MIAAARSDSTLNGAAIVGVAAWIAGVFFYKDHYLTVSLYDEWAPWASQGAVASGGNVVKGAALGTIGLLGAWLFATRKEGPRAVHGLLLAAVFAYVGWCAASVLWTVDRGATVRQLVVLVAIVIGAYGIASRTEPRDLLKMLLYICGAFVAIGFLAELALGTFRPWADGHRFAGTVHPNAQGGLCAILGISALAYLLSRGDESRGRSTSDEDVESRFASDAGWFVRPRSYAEWLPFALLGLAIVGVLLAKSRTCLGGFLLAAATMIAFRVTARTKATAGFALAWCAVGGLFLLALSGVDLAAEAESVMYMGREEETDALSGRLPIWTELSNYVADRPWTGYGYAAFWNDEQIETISADVMWTFREAHSSFFEILLSVGGVGLGLFIASVLIGGTLAFRRAVRGDAYAAYLLALFAFAGTTAFTESSVVWPCLETTVLGIGMFQIALRRGDATAFVPGEDDLSADFPPPHVSEGAAPSL